MERDEIIKALECCHSNELSCADCPYQDVDKFRECADLDKDALSLIKELTQKLECANLEIECKERICESYMLQYGTVADKEVWLKKERADTVRKMQNELKRTFSALCKGEMNDLFRIIDQIAKEMIGEAE